MMAPAIRSLEQITASKVFEKKALIADLETG